MKFAIPALLLCAGCLFSPPRAFSDDTLAPAAPAQDPAASASQNGWVQPRMDPAEVRGMWVVRTSITSPAAIAQVVAAARAHNFNTLFVQVRGRGDAYYTSTLEPRAEELSGTPAAFDPLGEIIRQAHAAGIQVHAWVNTCFVWSAAQRPLSPQHIVNAHADWLDRDASGHCSLTGGKDCEGAFLSLANLDARRHVHDVFLEIASKYDVDGIHFDYIRYPNRTYDYSDATLLRFRDQIAEANDPTVRIRLDARLAKDRLAYVHAFPEAFDDFRRDQVTETVRDISHDIKVIKPWVVISAAVFADSKDAYVVRGQDWKTWLREGYVDAVVPMAYGAMTANVAKQIADAVETAHQSRGFVYAGIGAWHISAASTIAKISAARQIGAQGEVLFSYGGVTKDGTTSTYLDKVGSACYSHSAAIPPMPWLTAPPASTSTSTTAPSTPTTMAGLGN